jgi:secreted trypsin-like serine protease
VQKSKIPKEKYFKYCETPEGIKSKCKSFDYQKALQRLKTVKPREVKLILQQVAICQNQESSKCEDNVKLRYPETLKVTEIDYIKLGNDKNKKMPVVIHGRSTKPNIPGPCNGDSGGPLMKLDKISGKFEVIGIVSGLKLPKKPQGPRGCLGPSPGVYGRVSSFVPWIKESMAKASNPDLFMPLYQPE